MRQNELFFYGKRAKRDLNYEISHIWKVSKIFIIHLIMMQFIITSPCPSSVVR